MEKKQIIKGKSGIVFYEYTSWCHRYKQMQPNGRVKYLKLKGFASEELALESYKKYEEEFKRQQREFYASINKDIMFKDYLIYWFENIYSERIEPSTILVGSYIVYELIIPNIEYDVKINQVTSDYLDEILEKASQFTESAGYSARSLLSICLHDAFIDHYIKYNPINNTKKYKRKKPSIRILNESQMKKFLIASQKTNWYLEILLGLFCGLRKAEILGLKFSDIDFENKTLEIKRQLARDLKLEKSTKKVICCGVVERLPKTKNSIRKIKIPDIVMDEIVKRRKVNLDNKKIYGVEYKDFDYVSCRDDGLNYNIAAMNSVISKICKKLSLPHITVHALRHMCATILIEQGEPLAKISAFLGHSSIHTTFEYYCETMNENEKILSFMNNIFLTNEESETNVNSRND